MSFWIIIQANKYLRPDKGINMIKTVLEELQLLKEAGLTNMQIIIAATKHAAEICSVNHEVGTIERGKIADLFIVEGNPLEDLECIYNVKMVIKEGCIVVEN